MFGEALEFTWWHLTTEGKVAIALIAACAIYFGFRFLRRNKM
jgi:hypothetical protein